MKNKRFGLDPQSDTSNLQSELTDKSLQPSQLADSEKLRDGKRTAKDQDYVGSLGLEEGILMALLGKELYGLQIIQAFEDASDRKRRLSVGTLYPALHRMEQRGFITSRMEERQSGSRSGARRKYFKISPNGARRLSEAQTLRERLHSWLPAV